MCIRDRRVGVVGEILVKFHPTANNQIVDVIEREGCEAVVPGLAEFFLFGIAGGIFQKDPLGRSAKGALGSRIGLWAIAKMRAPVTKALRAVSYTHLADAVRWVYWRFEYLPEKEGSYTIKVRSVNDEGDASPVAATHSFEVLPSF